MGRELCSECSFIDGVLYCCCGGFSGLKCANIIHCPEMLDDDEFMDDDDDISDFDDDFYDTNDTHI